MKLYGEREGGSARPADRHPRLPRIYAPGETMHVVARCNNRDSCFRAPEDSEIGGRASVPSAAPSS